MSGGRVPLSELLAEDKSTVQVVNGQEYANVGVLNRGRGLFRKPPLVGGLTSARRLHPIRAGQVIYSRLFAWEGSVTLVKPQFDASFVSNEFPHFDIDTSSVHVGFLRHALLADDFASQIARAGTGMGQRRRRVQVSAFLALSIPLPSLPRQRTIAARLDQVGPSLDAPGVELVRTLIDSSESAFVERAIVTRGVVFADLVDINPRTRFDDDVVHFIPMADLDEVSGAVVGERAVERGTLGSGYKRFQRGDVIFARITPCMQNGKSAIFDSNVSDLGAGSTEFHVLRPRAGVDPGAVHALVRSAWFRNKARRSFTGTAGQQRVPARFLASLVVPDLRLESSEKLVDDLVAAERSRRHVGGLASRRASLMKALPAAARNEVFSRL